MTEDPRTRFDDQAVVSQTAALRLMVRALIRDDATVDDVVQETWLTAMQRPVRPGFEPGAWLRGIARNVVRHLRRGDLRRADREAHATPRDAGAGPPEVVAKIERLQEVLEVLSGLHEPIRETVALRYLEGLMPREIAERLAVPVGTVKTRLNTGLRLLREALDARHGGDRSVWRALLLPLVPDLTPAAVVSAASVGTVIVGGALMKAALVVGGVVAIALVVFLLRPSGADDGGRIGPSPEAPASVAATPAPGTVERQKPVIRARTLEEAAPSPDDGPPAAGSARARGAYSRVTIKGRCVAAESGAPLAGCTVTLTGHQATGYALEWEHLDWRNPTPVTTGADGVFEFRLGLPQFESTRAGYAPRVHVSVEHPERTDAWGSVGFPDFPRGRTLDLGDASMHRGERPQIKVVDRQGRPVAGVQVAFQRAPDEPRDLFARAVMVRDGGVGRTRADGIAAVEERLRAGSWSAWLYREGVEAKVPFVVRPGAAAPAVTLVHEAAGSLPTISGRVVDLEDRPVAGIDVGGFDAQRIGFRDPSSTIGKTAEDGSFVIRATKESTTPATELMFTRNRRYDAWGTFGQFSWGDQNLKLVLRESTGVVLTVTTEDGAPVTDFAVRCVPAKGVESPGTVRRVGHHPGGRVELRGVASGPHRLFVFPLAAELAPSDWQSIQVPASGTAEVGVKLAPAVQRKVRIRRSDGAPVGGTKLELVFGGAEPSAGRRMPGMGVEWDPELPLQALRVDEGLTDAAGELVLRGPRSSDQVWIRALGPGHVPATKGLMGWSAGEAPVEIVVDAGSIIRGSVGPVDVLDALDATSRNKDATLPLHHGERPHAYAKPRADGGRPERPRILALTRADVKALDDRVLQQSGGVVIGSSGVVKPSWDTALDAWPLEREAGIGPDGTFEIRDVPAGVYQLHLVTFTTALRVGPRREIRPEPLATVTATPEKPAEVTLSIANALSRSVGGAVKLDGTALANAEVELFWPGASFGDASDRPRPTDIAATLRTDAAGRFRSRALPAGEYVAVAIVPAGMPVRIPAESRVVIQPDHATPLDLDFRWATVRFAEENGVRSGPWITWHTNGQKHSEGLYERGQREGPWKFWNLDGTPDPVMSGTYSAGVRTGP
jgi:RNA polymerase sigma-70 factor, ECF subfamily